MTQEIVENVVGARTSMDDFIQKMNPKPKGAQLEVYVRKAARSNLEGNIVRQLAGLNSVPLEHILDAYKDTPKQNRARFREGRGYGSQSDRTQTGAQHGQTGQDGEGKPQVDVITEAQGKRLYAIYKQAGWQDAEVKTMLQRDYGIQSSREIPKDKYDEIVKKIEGGASH
jgi:hypothetical protein